MAIGGSYIPCTSLMDVEVRSSSCGGWGGKFHLTQMGRESENHAA